MKVKIKKLHKYAVIPSYSRDGDAGLDLVATECYRVGDYMEYATGLSFEIPEGHVGLIYPRSSISNKDLSLSNSVGVIDSGYRGEVKFRFKLLKGSESFTYLAGEKIGQLIIMPYPKVEFEEVTELSDTERGQGGFGSTGS